MFFSRKSKVITDVRTIDEVLDRGTVVEILPSKKLFREKLLSGDRLRFYIGFDATAPTLHLSHAKNIIFLEKLRKLGHETILLFGDYTAQIGDPTGEDSTRKQLSKEEIAANVKEWKRIVSPLMDFNDKTNPPKIKYNSNWLGKLTLTEALSIASSVTVQQFLERDMFQERMKKEQPIFLNEFLYPLLQGYDSVAMDVDVELCGTDQTFNALVGRTLQKRYNKKEKFIVALTLMENPKTGELMSKSKGNGVFLGTSPEDLYGQIMAQPDEMILPLFTHMTDASIEEVTHMITASPRDAKLELSRQITKLLHGEKGSQKAQKHFKKVIQDKERPEEIVSVSVPSSGLLVDVLVEGRLVASKGEAKRVLKQGGVMVDGMVVEDESFKVKSGMKVQKGKRSFIDIR